MSMRLLGKELNFCFANPVFAVNSLETFETSKCSAGLPKYRPDPMSVAFFVDDFPSFTQTFVLRQFAGVMEAGWPVTIYAKRNSGLKAPHRLIESHQMMSKTLYLHNVPRSIRRRFVDLLIFCIKPGAIKHSLSLIRALNIFEYGREAASLKLAHQCLTFLKKPRFDILHSQFGWLGAAVCKMRRCGALSGKVVTSFRGYDTEQYLRKNPKIYRHLFRHGDLFLPVCDYFKQWLIANGCPEHKIEVLRSGIDLGELTFKLREYEPGRSIRLLSVARMNPKKGLCYALQAVARLIHAGRDIHFTILGDGPLRRNLEHQAVELGIGQDVSMPGMKPHKEVLAEINRSHIFLAPSVTAGNGDHEGIPNALKEAMATGMPVVSTYHSGIPELVKNGKTGFLVPEKNVDALEDRIRILLDHPALWNRMGCAGRSIIEKQYDINALNARLFELYGCLAH